MTEDSYNLHILFGNKIMSRPCLAINEFSCLNPEKETAESVLF